MKHYIIDGNNLIGKIKNLHSLQQKDKQMSREKLTLILERHFIKEKAKVTLHFDGFENDPIKTSCIKIVYSEKRTADENIKNQIEKSKKRTTITVVSSDNNIREFARVCSCGVIKSEDFAKKLSSSQSGDEEVERIKNIDNPDEFKKLFGVS